MQGGYVNDKWVQGGTNPDAYATWHWYLIDVFVYFSHSLVTLPPPCWTNTAHRRGVKEILFNFFWNCPGGWFALAGQATELASCRGEGLRVFGTFITEWDEGKLVRNKLLATMKSARMNAERLAELAVDLGFDGWLSNYPDLSAAVAGNRKFDVYMGMDVFGRKTFGGGQWNGQGYRVSVKGNQLTDAPWNNMSCQGFQMIATLLSQ
ncbi:cytosolic endo-beta-N-acetylglucosaminidase 2 isoform X5 [Populus trichocarpa]|uniref:cytosolic endo-beta-N-acetylglucosaminidase 2 isoform X5 n=1 Tax=Populus trichocarpa TaxID=3694 RepID=UPI0022799B88|nr:cytosolic endo-beta-N-acetylglucosaminidase 2 isoform X5 [Populus trichocarpa]